MLIAIDPDEAVPSETMVEVLTEILRTRAAREEVIWGSHREIAAASALMPPIGALWGAAIRMTKLLEK